MKCVDCDKLIMLPYKEGLYGTNDSSKVNFLCEECSLSPLAEDRLMDRLSKMHFASLRGGNSDGFTSYLLSRYKLYNIRFINPQSEFDFARFGSYFFHGGAMYVITDRQEYKEYDVRRSLSDTYYNRVIKPNNYIIKGLYAGHDTGFKDDNNESIYTGDIVRTKGTHSKDRDPHQYFQKDRYTPEENEHLYECYGVVSSYTSCLEAYQVALDNHGAFLCHSSELEILGNIFYDLTPGETVDIWKESCSLAQSGYHADGFWRIHTRDSIKDDLKKIKTPGFKES